MIKLTEFTSVVDTYKKNFDLRSKRFNDKKKKDTAEKKENRENRIEPKKFLGGLKGDAGNIAKKMKPGGDILDTVIRFGAFTLIGLIVKNIDKIAIAVKAIIEKIKEFAIKAKKFFEEEVVPFLKDVYNLGKDIFNVFVGIGDFLIDLNPFKDFDSILNTVILGILGIAQKLGNLYSPKAPSPTPPAAAGLKKEPTKTPTKTPAKSLTRTPTKAAVNLKTKKFSPTKSLTGAGISKGVSSIFTDRGDIPKSNRLTTNLEKTIAREYSLRELSNIADDPKMPADVRAAASKIIRLELEKVRIASPDEVISKQKIRGPYSPLESKPSTPTIPKPLPGLTNLQKIKRGVTHLTKGLDFRFSLRDVVKFFKPENLKNVLKGGATGLVTQALLEWTGKTISDNLPYSQENETFGYLGLISQERIAALRAKTLMSMDIKKRNKILEELSDDANSQPFFIDSVGKLKKSQAQSILDEYLKLQLKSEDQSAKIKPKVPVVDDSLEKIEFPEYFNNPNLNKRADEDNYDSGGNKIRIGDTVGGDISRGLNSSTTYDNQGRFISREVLIALQPIEKEVLVPVEIG